MDISKVVELFRSALPEDFDRAVIYGYVDDYGSFDFQYYVEVDGRYLREFASRVDLLEMHQAVYAECTKGDKAWNTFTLVIESNGVYNIDYSEETETEDLDAWEEKYLI